MRRTTTLALSAILALVALGLLTPAANAAKPTASGGGGKPASGGSGSMAVVLVDSPDSVANYSETITFQVSTTATDRPFVQVDCYQGGTRVYGMSAGFFADYPFTKNYTLRSSNWTGGAADCTAKLYYSSSSGKTVVLNTMNFGVAA